MTPSSVDSLATTVFDASAMLSFSKPAAVTKDVSLQFHIVLHLERDCAIEEAWQNLFYKYIIGCLRSLKCDLQAIGGAGDHVHLLVNLNSTDAPADVVRRLKLLSTSWVLRNAFCRNFAWREDYQAFTVSRSQSARVRRYIFNQKQHHRSFGAAEDYPSSWGCAPRNEIGV
ncbi:MAG: transposase [Acidobacteriota bacterium]|nr:transposase [Acidobacteriota bacterium]